MKDNTKGKPMSIRLQSNRHYEERIINKAKQRLCSKPTNKKTEKEKKNKPFS